MVVILIYVYDNMVIPLLVPSSPLICFVDAMTCCATGAGMLVA